jgi:hypothetical protein
MCSGMSWSWSCGSWINKYLFNQCLSPLKFESCSGEVYFDTTLCDKVCQWLATGRLFSLGSPVSCTNKTDRRVITEILLQVLLNTKTLTPECVLQEWKLFYANFSKIFSSVIWQLVVKGINPSPLLN